ncbi:hypothetical protein ARMSODRAFT_1027109 [Armillaria solidipes]|uniref:Uncharacterized protein n=1 Tax=Armillaria solidipes TaxID=1076256 RepID=A0A2H3B1E3_9AGAR|nr:hypothetical protein ARMSODRAFT_1027109 [Armillaria solidipes]
MRWLAPPDRRELTLIIFCLTIFTFAYNFTNSTRFLGIDAAATQGVLGFGSLGFGASNIIGSDGRKLVRWRDAVENLIFGDWGWDSGHIAGDGLERSQALGVEPHHAMWMSGKEIPKVNGIEMQPFVSWGRNVPTVKVLQHTPGHSVLDNVILFKGNVYLVTDDPGGLPSLNSIVSPPNFWSKISTAEAIEEFGTYGGRLGGVTFISTDPTLANSTLHELWRTYSALDPSIDAEGRTILPQPQRLFMPFFHPFTDPDPPYENPMLPRPRTDTGFHPFLVKAAFPQMTVMFDQDWMDYHFMEVPYVVERMVIVDRNSGNVLPEVVSPYWWEPIRKQLSTYLNLENEKSKKKVITYVHRQNQYPQYDWDPPTPKLRTEDHELLVKKLEKMAYSYGHEFNVVSALDFETSWHDRISSIARSTVLLGAHGSDLMDGMFMRRTPQTTVIEFFPQDRFVRDRATMAHGLGMHYVAWCNDQKYTSDNLPPISKPENDEATLTVNADLVVQTVRDILSRS